MTDERRFYVYVHKRVDTLRPFYVGKGCDDRAWEIGRSETHKQICSSCGVVVEIIKDQLTHKEALIEERKLVASLILEGETLLNKYLLPHKTGKFKKPYRPSSKPSRIQSMSIAELRAYILNA